MRVQRYIYSTKRLGWIEKSGHGESTGTIVGTELFSKHGGQEEKDEERQVGGIAKDVESIVVIIIGAGGCDLLPGRTAGTIVAVVAIVSLWKFHVVSEGE